jgi:WxcM-like, C-terminal
MNSQTVFDCSLVELDKHHRPQGNLSIVQSGIDIPFDVKRLYYIYDIPGGESRGGHAHRVLKQLIISGSGSFDVVLDDGKNRKTITLNRPYYGLLIIPGIWRELINFSSGAICMVLASEKYDEEDYIREYELFLKYKNL